MTYLHVPPYTVYNLGAGAVLARCHHRFHQIISKASADHRQMTAYKRYSPFPTMVWGSITRVGFHRKGTPRLHNTVAELKRFPSTNIVNAGLRQRLTFDTSAEFRTLHLGPRSHLNRLLCAPWRTVLVDLLLRLCHQPIPPPEAATR